MRTSLITQLVKNPPAMQETLALFLGWEDPLEKGKAIPPILWPREFHGLYSPWCLKESDMTGHKGATLNIYTYIYIYIYFRKLVRSQLLHTLHVTSTFNTKT